MIFLALGVAATSPAQSPHADDPSRARAEDSSLYRIAVAKLEALAQKEGLESRQEMLVRNLSRYFVVYLVPSLAEELSRVLGTAQRMTQQAGRAFLGLAQTAARDSGSDRVELRHVEAVASQLLPRQRGDLDDWVYLPTTSPTRLEEWDLEAFRSTGLAWEVLGYLADVVIAPDPEALEVTDEAARALAETLNAYGLLVFRLGGHYARADKAPHLTSQHLRLAGKAIAGREPVPDLDTPQAAEPSHFVDVTARAGLDFLHRSSDWLSRFRRFGDTAPTFSGGGVAAGDVDGDRWDDLVLCGGRGCALYRNRGDRSFEDRTVQSGIGHDGEARMPILADFDNDGDQDLFVTYARDSNRLFLNLGSGRFQDATVGSGLEVVGDISGPAAAVDVDGDGLLDLYVGNFGDYLGGEQIWTPNDARNGMPNRLYRNLGVADGRLRFQDVTTRAGVGDTGWAQALSHLDYDGDGDQDLYVANDFGRNQLYENRGDGVFEAAGERTFSDDRYHGMNVAFADLNHDRLPDIFITNIWFWASARRELTETNTLLLSNRRPDGAVVYERSDHPVFRDHDSGWAWAGLFFDVENDGDEDLFVANGFTDYMTFVQYRQHPEVPDRLYPIHNGREPNLLFLGEGDDRSQAAIPSRLAKSSGIELPGINSRSAALLDFDHDGDLDLVVTAFHERARLFENVAGDREQNRWLSAELLADPGAGSPRDAIGAVVVATTSDGALEVWRSVTGGEGYLGQSSKAVHFGVGQHATVDLEIRWPSGASQRLSAVATGRAISIVEGREQILEVWSPASSASASRSGTGGR